MHIKFTTFIEREENGKTYLVVRNFPVPLTGETKEFTTEVPEGTEPLVCFTATTNMIETIGNMADENHAFGYAFNNAKHKFTVSNPFDIAKGERVYITEHLRLDGKPEYIVTKHRILQGANNFVNFGYVKDENRIVKLIVDVITGEHKWA
jgi:hypothetical protein